MSIYIEGDHQGKGLARRMVRRSLVSLLKRLRGDPQRLLYIDVDASAGFWEHMGLADAHRYADILAQRHVGFEGAGYEKSIKFADLRRWAMR